jgi:hypothetical protein
MYKVQNAITELLMIPNRPSNGVKIPPMTNWKVVPSILTQCTGLKADKNVGTHPYIHTCLFTWVNGEVKTPTAHTKPKYFYTLSMSIDKRSKNG